ncbi:SusC/RagA family TonB-linked outer membrane protein [Echinicola pacifica]|uniref:SusC/RagA family TonB-linked outer membrane protein n=1 Tax=Echinicola pacifica TaxID=346377 RepID=A0A918Q2Z3_9BACT|nr:TonB-dependent receptor [Echinicola pacifica]GGZ30532.1 SusC/RagA family TonB-linked outer membrane protein [Echinicola pacifica]
MKQILQEPLAWGPPRKREPGFQPNQIWKKVIILFLLISPFTAYVQAYTNDLLPQLNKVYITLGLQDQSLEEALQKIEGETPYTFSYRSAHIAKYASLSLSEEKRTLENTLEILLGETDLTYERVKNSIVILPRGEQVNPEVKAALVSEAIIEKKVSGQVTSEAEPMGIPGVNVRVEGTTKGTVTDIDGKYSLTVPDDATVLEFSFVGYKTVKITVGNQSTVNIEMEELLSGLNEVVVVGYGVQKKSDLTGSVVSLTEENFTQGANSNALQLLNGRAAGVSISQPNSAPGAQTKIQIRGAGSINGDNSALIVVDGLPGINPADLSPDDIASIEVLKDASSAAIYGTRAANGVVLITTKTGKKGDPVLKYNTYYGIQSVAKRVDVLNGREYMETLNGIRADGGGQPIYTDEEVAQMGAGTNWQDVIFNQNAPVQNHQISMSGGSDKSTYYAGLNYFNQDGLVKNSNFKKLNLRANMDFKPKEFLRFKFNVNYTRSVQNSILFSNAANESAGPINSAIQFDPTLPSGLNSDGRYYLNSFIALDNPEALINGVSQENLDSRFYGTFTTEFEPIKGLIGSVRLGGTNATGMTSNYRDRNTINGLSNGGIGSREASDYTQWLAEFLVKYDKEFNKDHHLNVLVGSTFEEFLTVGVDASSRGFLSDVTNADLLQSGDGDEGDNVQSSRSRNRLNGFLGRVNYDLKGRYLFTASIRADGTSRFSDTNKFAVFPSGAFAWRISDEPFFQGLTNTFSTAKVRLGYGQLGNQGVPNFSTIQTLIAGGSAVFGDAIYQGVVPARLPNPNLKWETTEEINLGLDFGFAGDRVNGSLDFYVRNTRDQIFSKPIPAVVGFSNILVNFGSARNSGIDFMLNSVNIDQDKFKWNSTLNFSVLKNEVTALPDFIPEIVSGQIGTFISNYLLVREGVAMRSFYGYETEGIFQLDDDIADSSQPDAKPGHIKFKDQNQDGVIDLNDRVVLGDPFPDFSLGFSNSFTYKHFTLDIFLQWINGIQTLDANVTESLYPTNEYRNRIAEYLINRWTPENPTNEYPSGVNPTAYGGDYIINSMTVKDASYIRLKTITLGYDFPLNGSKIFRNINAYAAVDNLFTITDFEGFDPDASATGTGSVSKVNYNSYPLSRTLRFGLNVTF